MEAIYCFEPIKSTFEILQTNITLNNIQHKTYSFNIALGEGNYNGEISLYDNSNIGATQIIPAKTQADIQNKIAIERLDDFMDKNFKHTDIDFIKIDVEGFEYDVLNGAVNTIKKYQPIIAIEIFNENFEKNYNFFRKISYKIAEQLDETNYIFKP